MSITVVGSVALDTVETPSGKRKNLLGGSATYFSVSAAVFTSVNLVGVVGRDFPSGYLKLLKKKRVDLKGLSIEKGKTFSWSGRYTRDLANPQTLSTSLNVLARFNPSLPSEYRKARFLFLGNIAPRIQRKVLEQTKPKLVACDTMNYWIRNARKELLRVLKKIDIFFLNESEARELTSQSNIIKATRDLFKLGPRIVVIKKGENGALLFSERFSYFLPAYLLEKVVDPTGAGDTFAGGFLGSLTRAEKLTPSEFKRALVWGNIMASFAVEDFGLNRLLSLTRAELKKRLRYFKRRSCFSTIFNF